MTITVGLVAAHGEQGSSRAVTAAGSRGTAVLRIYDESGRRLSWTAFRRRQANGRGDAGANDQLVDPDTLSPVVADPLYHVGGEAGFDWPGRPVALALAWPSSEGYDNLIVDVPGPGRHDFNRLAAGQAVAALERGLRSHGLRHPSRRLRRLRGAAQRDLRCARSASSERRRGACGARSLDAARRAQVQMLVEAGRAESRGSGREWAVTFDSVPRGDGAYESVRDLFGRDGWVRIVFDASAAPADYRTAVDRAHAFGLHVTGELVDSSDMRRFSLAEFQARVREYVDALPAVDEWEVGNEVNQRDLGPDVEAKVEFAVRYVREHTSARTLLTLYWQLGEDDPKYSVFDWLDRNAALARSVDDVGLSVYPDQHPLGSSLERVMNALHERLPGQRLLITELGYATPDGESTWWWGSRRDAAAGRRAVARFYQSAVMAFPWSGGGAYWWYYLDEAADRGALWRTLREAYVGSAR